MTKHETVTIRRDVEGTAIPAGNKIFVPQDTVVTITQTLGGSYTVLTDRGFMIRIEAKDADALGKKPPEVSVEVPAPVENPGSKTELEEQVWEALKSVYDPEIPVNIVDLGLVYRMDLVSIDKAYEVEIDMSMTAPGCGMGDVIAQDAKDRVTAVPGIRDAFVSIVWDPPWDQSRMSEAARLQLGMDY